MHCFVHNAVPAIGICKFCGKGLCPQCSADTGLGLACHGSCEEQVEIMGRMIAQNPKIMRTANAQNRSFAIFGIIMGVLFLGFCGLAYTGGNELGALFFGGMGLLFAGHGLVRLTTHRYPNSD